MSAEQTAAFTAALPHLAAGLCPDRTWLWWSGPKPPDEEREKMLALGWHFTARPHALPDGRTAHWYHACGGKIIYRKRHERSRANPESSSEKPSDSMDALRSLAASFT